MPQATARVWNTGTPEEPIFNFELPAGPKGEPGGWVPSSDLGTMDLDAVTTPGLYRASAAANVTLDRHYPIAGAQGTGVLEVIWQGGTVTQAKIQRYTIVWGNSSARVIFIRHYLSSAWGPWQPFSSQRVDSTAGRAIYTWDDTAGREQLIYGDTGVRNIISGITSQNPAAADPSVLIHRQGGVVNMYFENLQPAVAGDWTPFLSLPTGFRPRLRNPHRFFVTATNMGEQRSMFLYTSGAMTIFGCKAGDNIRFSLTYPTYDPWPTSLPGTPV